MSFVTHEQILKVLIGFNPWWSSSKIPNNLTKPTKRLAFYEAKKNLLPPSNQA